MFRANFSENKLELTENGFEAEFAFSLPAKQTMVVVRKIEKSRTFSAIGLRGDTGKELARIADVRPWHAMAVSPDLKQAAYTTGQYDQAEINILDLVSGKSTKPEVGRRGATSLQYHQKVGFAWLEKDANGRSIIMSCRSATDQPRRYWSGTAISAFAFSPAGDSLFLGQVNAQSKPILKLHNPKSGMTKLIVLPSRWSGPLSTIIPTADGRIVFVKADFNMVAVEVATGKEIDFRNSIWYARPVVSIR